MWTLDKPLYTSDMFLGCKILLNIDIGGCRSWQQMERKGLQVEMSQASGFLRDSRKVDGRTHLISAQFPPHNGKSEKMRCEGPLIEALKRRRWTE